MEACGFIISELVFNIEYLFKHELSSKALIATCYISLF